MKYQQYLHFTPFISFLQRLKSEGGWSLETIKQIEVLACGYRCYTKVEKPGRILTQSCTARHKNIFSPKTYQISLLTTISFCCVVFSMTFKTSALLFIITSRWCFHHSAQLYWLYQRFWADTSVTSGFSSCRICPGCSLSWLYKNHKHLKPQVY